MSEILGERFAFIDELFADESIRNFVLIMLGIAVIAIILELSERIRIGVLVVVILIIATGWWVRRELSS